MNLFAANAASQVIRLGKLAIDGWVRFAGLDGDLGTSLRTTPRPAPAPACAPASLSATRAMSEDLALAVAPQGLIYIADREHNVLWRIEAAGAVSRVAGAGTATRFTQLGAIAADPRGGVVVADKHAIRRVSAGGVVTTLAGSVEAGGCIDGSAGQARFDLPDGLAVAAGGIVYVADTTHRTIRKIAASGEVTTIGSADGEYRDDATVVQLRISCFI